METVTAVVTTGDQDVLSNTAAGLTEVFTSTSATPKSVTHATAAKGTGTIIVPTLSDQYQTVT